jgi:Uma2 family endonuclease
MVTVTHELCVRALDDLIGKKIDKLREESGPVGELTALVVPRGEADVPQLETTVLAPGLDLKKPRELRPDASWGLADASYPGLAVEVANSQSTLSLLQKTNMLLGFTDGNVRCVIAVDLEYKGREAKVAVYKSYVDEPEDNRGLQQCGSPK